MISVHTPQAYIIPEGDIICEAYITRSGTERISLKEASFATGTVLCVMQRTVPVAFDFSKCLRRRIALNIKPVWRKGLAPPRTESGIPPG